MLQRMIGAAMLRTGTYEEVEADTSATKQAMLVVVLVSLASGTLAWAVSLPWYSDCWRRWPAGRFGRESPTSWVQRYFRLRKLTRTGAVGANFGLCPNAGSVQGFWVFARDRPYYLLHRDHLAVDRRDYRDRAGPGLHVHPAGNRGCGYRVHRLRRRDRNSDGDIRVPDYTRLITTD